jgi:hypothetical protein
VWLPQLREFGHNKIKLILGSLQLLLLFIGSQQIIFRIVGNKADKVMSEGQRDVSVETGIEFAEKHNVDFLEVSAFTGLNVEKMFRRISLSVAKLLPDVKQHLELLSLPDGWLAIMPPQLMRDTSGGSQDLLVGTSGGSSGTSEPVFPRAPVKTSSFNLTDSPESFRPIGIGGDSVINRRRSLRRDNSSPTSKGPSHAPKVRYINYWTGEEVDETPSCEADPGLLFTALPPLPPRPVVEEGGRASSLELTAAEGQKAMDDIVRGSFE